MARRDLAGNKGEHSRHVVNAQINQWWSSGTASWKRITEYKTRQRVEGINLNQRSEVGQGWSWHFSWRVQRKIQREKWHLYWQVEGGNQVILVEKTVQRQISMQVHGHLLSSIYILTLEISSSPVASNTIFSGCSLRFESSSKFSLEPLICTARCLYRIFTYRSYSYVNGLMINIQHLIVFLFQNCYSSNLPSQSLVPSSNLLL